MEQAGTLPTASALRLAGVAPAHWAVAIGRNLFPEAPKVKARERKFNADDLIALQFYGELLRIGVVVNKAAPLASELRAVLSSDPTVEKVFMATVNERGRIRSVILQRPGTASILWELDIVGWRQIACEAIEAQAA